MSILSALRDTAATLSLERALQLVRDQQLKRMLAGRPMAEDELRQAEQDAVLQVARQLYCDETALAMGFAQKTGQLDHRKQYAERATAAADWSILISHQHLCRIPIVGDPAFAPT